MKLSDREWKDFAAPYVFQNIQRGKRLKKADHILGIVPYVSSTANNNGVDAYIEATKGTRVFENCISLAIVEVLEQHFMSHLHLLQATMLRA